MIPGIPLLGASAILTDRGITVFRARWPKLFQTWDWTFRESAVLPSNIVSTIRKSNDALSLDFTRSITLMSVGRPSMGKNSHWTGIRTRSEVTRALSVSRPMFGGQSITIVLNWSLIGVRTSRRTYSRPGVLDSSTSALARSRLLGRRNRFWNLVERMVSSAFLVCERRL